MRPAASFHVGLFAALATLMPSASAAGIEPAPALPPAPPALQQALDAARGRAVVVNFWASWCEPCRREMPALVELDEHEPGLALVTVAVADRAADTRRFLADYLIETTVVVADPDQAIARAWNARMIPTTYVLDARHQPRYRVVGEADWRDAALQDRVRALVANEPQGSTK
ncbi:MAG: TlpA family protein disulfide reductase [Luteimonas sp.]|nr:TlpA family protein disulfide reductase [Luteimonas sp.]